MDSCLFVMYVCIREWLERLGLCGPQSFSVYDAKMYV